MLQDENPLVSGASSSLTAQVKSACDDQASDYDGGGNTNGARSCYTEATAETLESETFNTQEGDNDKIGDGFEDDCQVLAVTYNGDVVEKFFTKAKDPESIEFAMLMLGTGLIVSWMCYYCYNRYHRTKDINAAHAGETAWQKEQGETLIKDELKTSVFSNGRAMKGTGGGNLQMLDNPMSGKKREYVVSSFKFSSYLSFLSYITKSDFPPHIR